MVSTVSSNHFAFASLIILEELPLLAQPCGCSSKSAQLCCRSDPGTSTADALSQFGELRWHKIGWGGVCCCYCFFFSNDFLPLTSLLGFCRRTSRNTLRSAERVGIWQEGLLPRSSTLFSPGSSFHGEQDRAFCQPLLEELLMGS